MQEDTSKPGKRNCPSLTSVMLAVFIFGVVSLDVALHYKRGIQIQNLEEKVGKVAQEMRLGKHNQRGNNLVGYPGLQNQFNLMSMDERNEDKISYPISSRTEVFSDIKRNILVFGGGIKHRNVLLKIRT